MPFVHRAGGCDVADANSYTETIPTLAGGGVLVISTALRGASINSPLPTLTLGSATFTVAQTFVPLSTRTRHTVFYSTDYAAGTSVSLTVDLAGNLQAGLFWSVEEQTGGLPGTLVQSNQTQTASATNLVTSLSAGSGEMVVSGHTTSVQAAGISTVGSGTKLFESVNGSSPSGALLNYWDPVVRTNPQVTWQVGGSANIIACEFTAPAPPTTTQAEIGWASLEIPDVPIPVPEGQVAYARLEVPDAPTVPDPWDPAPECETMEYRNPAGEVVRFRTLIGTVGRFMPPIGLTTIPVPAGHGSHYLGAAHLERPVAVPVALPGPLDGRADLRNWARILDPSVGEGTLTVVEGTWAGRRLRCVYEAGLDEWEEMHRRYNQGVLLFRAAWPYWEDSNEFTVDTDQDDTTHTWFPFLPLVFGASDAFSLFTVDNTGDVDAWPVITVYGPGEDVSVTNVTTGATWTVNGPLLPGSVLEVDHRPGHKTVRVDGVNAFDQLAESSSLWPLARGINQVEVGAIDTDVDTLITFTWRRLWLAA